MGKIVSIAIMVGIAYAWHKGMLGELTGRQEAFEAAAPPAAAAPAEPHDPYKRYENAEETPEHPGSLVADLRRPGLAAGILGAEPALQELVEGRPLRPLLPDGLRLLPELPVLGQRGGKVPAHRLELPALACLVLDVVDPASLAKSDR